MEKNIPFPECAENCEVVKILGVGECEYVCPQRFNTNGNPLTMPIIVNHDSELKRITEILAELRQLRDSHNGGYLTFYNTVCDRLDFLQSKLIHGL